MTDGSLFTAIGASTIGSAVLTIVLFYLSRLPGSDPAVRLWAAAYGCHALRQATSLAAAAGTPGMAALGEGFMVLFTVLLLAGSLKFIRRRVPVLGLSAATVASLGWVIAADALDLGFLWTTAPVYTSAGAAMLLTAGVLWRQSRLEPGVGHRPLAVAFALWGLHLADYPFLRPLPAFAQIGFLLSSGLALAIALGLIVIVQRRQQLIAEAAVAREQRAAARLGESEARFRNLADTMPALLYVTDRTGGCTFVNKTWLDYTGRSLEEEHGSGWMAGVPPEDLALIAEQEAAAFDARQPYSFTYRLRGRNGQLRWFLDTARPRLGPDGTFLGYIGTLVDMTEQRELADQLQQAHKMEAVGQLTGGIAHDFNNLLAIVLGNLDLVDERLPADSTLRGLVRDALRAAERGGELTGRLLAFARRQPLKPECVDVNRLIAGTTSLLRRTLGSNIRIETVPAEDSPPVVVDPTQLESALLNLAINARDAMPDGGKLTIETANAYLDEKYASAQAEVIPGQYVVICMTDTGTGMSKEVLGRAFEPFFTTKGLGHGSGLGLSMVYGFVEQSGGRVTIDSAPGRGTTVRLLLPRAQAAAEPEAATAASSDRQQGAGELILLVEDDPAVRQLAAELLSGLGYRYVEAEDGPTALARLAETPQIALLLSDVLLPRGMNGFALARQARELRPDLRTLFMSGYAESAFAERDPDEGEIDLIRKPFRKAELAARLRSALARPVTFDVVERAVSA